MSRRALSLPWRRVKRGVLVGVFAAFALGAVAVASIPDANQVFHACYDATNSGTAGGYETGIRVIDTATEPNCPSGQTEVTFNQRGPQGPQGAQGPQGFTGPQGAPGPTAPTAQAAEAPHVPAAGGVQYAESPPARDFTSQRDVFSPFYLTRGGWDVSASLSIGGSHNEEVRCRLYVGSGGYVDSSSQFLEGRAGRAAIDLHWTGKVYFGEPAVSIHCAAGTLGTTHGIRIVAIPVNLGSLTPPGLRP